MSDEDLVKPTAPETGQTVTCAVCRRELPADRAVTEEMADYVLWFCGQDCYSDWRRQREVSASRKERK